MQEEKIDILIADNGILQTLGKKLQNNIQDKIPNRVIFSRSQNITENQIFVSLTQKNDDLNLKEQQYEVNITNKDKKIIVVTINCKEPEVNISKLSSDILNKINSL